MDSVTVGLDIGSSAVRAAEIAHTRDARRVLRRYGQIGLPPGCVVDGEILDIPGVANALKRLWLEAGFTETKVVLGVSGPRVFVRQAEVPAVDAADLRSSLQFNAQEMIPIPMEDASFDFSILGPAEPQGSDKQETQKILLVAAHRDLLQNYLLTLKAAGLEAVAMDAAPLALIRAVPVSSEASEVEVIVSIGAELTTVAVRAAGVPQFIRTLTLGGGKLTESIANNLHLEYATAERLKRRAVDGQVPQLGQARKAMSSDLRALAEDVRATIDFFVSQASGAEIDRLLVTGGGSETEGLAASIAGNLPTQVMALNPFSGLDTASSGLDAEQLQRAASGAATAIGLALWPTEAPLIRLSVLPEEVAAARRARRLLTLAAVGVAGLAGVLGALGVGEIYAVHSAQNKVHAEQERQALLAAKVSHLQTVTAVHGRMEARAHLVVSALQGDVDWVRLLGQLSTVMPPNLKMTNFTGSRATSSSSNTGNAGVGSLTFNVHGTGGLPAVSAWIHGLQSDPNIDAVWISGVTVKSDGGDVQFSSNAMLTPLSESGRAKEVQK